MQNCRLGNTHTPFRSLCMRTSYLTDDRPDVRFAHKESAKLMSEACVAGWDNVQTPWQHVLAFSDSGHAGWPRTRRSTSCILLMQGRHVRSMICSTQIPAALSSGDSEWYVLTHAVCAFIRLRSPSRDLGRVHGAGRFLHIKTRILLTPHKVHDNPADLGLNTCTKRTRRTIQTVDVPPRDVITIGCLEQLVCAAGTVKDQRRRLTDEAEAQDARRRSFTCWCAAQSFVVTWSLLEIRHVCTCAPQT